MQERGLQQHTLRGKSRGKFAQQVCQEFDGVRQGIGSLSARLLQAVEQDKGGSPRLNGQQDDERDSCTSCASGESDKMQMAAA